VCGVWCVVCGVWCVVCGVWCVVCGVWCVVCGVWCVVCGVWCVLCVVCVVYGVWCMGYGVWVWAVSTCVWCVVGTEIFFQFFWVTPNYNNNFYRKYDYPTKILTFSHFLSIRFWMLHFQVQLDNCMILCHRSHATCHLRLL
jgi:hypothetical protein